MVPYALDPQLFLWGRVGFECAWHGSIYIYFLWSTWMRRHGFWTILHLHSKKILFSWSLNIIVTFSGNLIKCEINLCNCALQLRATNLPMVCYCGLEGKLLSKADVTWEIWFLWNCNCLLIFLWDNNLDWGFEHFQSSWTFTAMFNIHSNVQSLKRIRFLMMWLTWMFLVILYIYKN